MYRISLPTNRPFNWKALWVLLVMLLVAAPIVIPFTLTLTGNQIEQQLAKAGSSMPVWAVLIINVSVVNFVTAGSRSILLMRIRTILLTRSKSRRMLRIYCAAL